MFYYYYYYSLVPHTPQTNTPHAVFLPACLMNQLCHMPWAGNTVLASNCGAAQQNHVNDTIPVLLLAGNTILYSGIKLWCSLSCTHLMLVCSLSIYLCAVLAAIRNHLRNAWRSRVSSINQSIMHTCETEHWTSWPPNA
jgi:hypothetical protein